MNAAAEAVVNADDGCVSRTAAAGKMNRTLVLLEVYVALDRASPHDALVRRPEARARRTATTASTASSSSSDCATPSCAVPPEQQCMKRQKVGVTGMGSNDDERCCRERSAILQGII